MAEVQLAITKEYIRCFLALMGKGIFWPEALLASLARQGLDPLDVTYVMTHGDPVGVEKEDAYGTLFEVIGTTCDDDCVRVLFWADPNQLDLRIIEVERM